MNERLDELAERDGDGALDSVEAAELRRLLAQPEQRDAAVAQRRLALLIAAYCGRSAATVAELVLAVDKSPSTAQQIAATAFARKAPPSPFRRYQLWAAMLLTGILLIGGAALYLRQEPGFVAINVHGTVSTSTADSRAATPLQVGERIPFGSTLELGADAQVSVQGDDGSQLELAGGTRLRVDDEQGTVLHLERGEVRGDIRHQPAGRPMRLVGARAMCTVLGTRLAFATAADQDRIQVIQGLVRAERVSDHALAQVGSGETLDIPASGSLLPRPYAGAPPADPAMRAAIKGSTLYNPNERYDVNLPLYPVAYSDEQKAAQRVAGRALVKEVIAAVKAGRSEYSAKPGVYRLPKGSDFEFGGAGDFALHLPDCELVMEDAAERCLFKFGKAKSFTMTGPVKIDCDALVESQGRILTADYATRQMTIAILPGYHALAVGPKDKQLFHCYTPQGLWLANPAYSDFAWKDAVLAADGRTVTIHAGMDYKREAWEELYRAGNLVTVGNAGSGVLFCIWPDQLGELTVQDLDFFGGGFGWGNATGNASLTRVRGMRRPGTNRLAGGGGWQSSKRQGRVTFESCEFRTTNDDILDLSSGSMDMVWQHESPRTLVIWTWSGHHYESDQLGSAFMFYRKDFARLAEAKLAAAPERIPDAQAKPWLEPAAALVKSKLDFKAFNDGRAFWRLTFDRDLALEPGTLTEDIANRQMEVVMRNCCWLDCGMRVMVQSGRRIEITNNHFVRISAGLHACTDAWWWQGETVHDVLIADNVFIASCYGDKWNAGKAAINVHNGNTPILDFPLGYPHSDIVIRDNLIQGASSGAILVQNAERVQITGNDIHDVFQHKEPTAAIALSGCARVTVSGNQLDGSPAPAIKAEWVDGLTCLGNAASHLGAPGKPVFMLDFSHVRTAQVDDNSAEKSQLEALMRLVQCAGFDLARNAVRDAPATPLIVEGAGNSDLRRKP